MKPLRTAALAALVIAAPARAAIEARETFDIELWDFVPCANFGAGEDVHLAGRLHVVSTFVINRGGVAGRVHVQPQGVHGVGQSTGTAYRGTGVTQSHFRASFRNGQYRESFVNNFRLIGQGPGNNFVLHANVGLTVNANGDVTASVDNFRVDCK